MRLAIDALNLRADERGMGRYVRRIIRDLVARPDWQVTLLVHDPAETGFYRTIAGEAVAVAPPAAARKRATFDAVWYPWNAWRFDAVAPSLVTINDDFAFRFPARGLVAQLREQLPVRRAIRRATRITTISQWSRTVLARRFRLEAERIGILPLAPDPWFTPGDEVTPFAEPFVLFVGGGERRKNLERLMHGFGRAFPDGDVRLVIVGNVEAKASFPVTVLPRSDENTLRTLYRTARAVAVPSLAEGFGLVVVEAQACGAAVIAADTAALPEAAGEGAILADPNRTLEWTSALLDVVEDDATNAHLRRIGQSRWRDDPRDGATTALIAQLHDLSGPGDRAGVRALC